MTVFDPNPVQSVPTAGVDVGEKVYVWSERLDAESIAAKKRRRKVQDAVNASVLVATSVFLLAAGWIAAMVAGSSGGLWRAAMRPGPAGLCASLAFLCGAFVFERIAEVSRQRVRMPSFPRGEDRPNVLSPVPEGDRANVADLFHPEAMKAVEEAYELAAKFGHAQLLAVHLFVASLSHGDVPVVFGRLGIPFDELREALNRRLLAQPVGPGPAFSSEAEQVLLAAFANACAQGRGSVSATEVFFEAYRRDAFVQELLYDKKTDESRLANVVEWIRITDALRERYDKFRRAAAFKPSGSMNRSMTAVQTPALDAVSEDLTAQAVSGGLPMLIGREREMDELLRVIEGGGQNVLLVGPEGVGKTAMLAGLAERMVREDVPKMLQDRRLVSVVLPSLTGGVNAAEAQARLIAALSDASKARNIVLVMQNVDQVAASELAPLLADALSRRIAFVIATTTPQGFSNVVERSVLSRVFEKVNVAEPDTDAAIHVVESKVGAIEYEQNVIFTFDAVERSVTLSDRYVHTDYLPKKAIQICKEAALIAFRERGANALVGGADVERVLADKTGIPMTQVNADEKEKLLSLEDKIHARVIGQEEAVKAVSSALRRARSELRATNKPISTFLFLGPSGVGKTALAKAVAASYFGGESNLLRFDMSEYQDQASVYRLIGAPGGESGQLTEAVRRTPFSLLLLDEFEKAHPNILNLFLQVFDEGRLTDSQGQTVDFTNTIIIVTSNAGSDYIQAAVGAGTPVDQIKTRLLEEELRGVYRTELLNRFDGVIVFRPLTTDDVQQITYLMIAQVAERLEAKGISFRATDEAVADLAGKGFDPKFGARPLRRIIQEEVDNAIATALLEGRVGRRDTIVLNPGGRIEIEKAAAL
ncbi:ATP-dependent Clp protease ATP-binding subunit [bacterium]|nr:ATP-dependent Clp protease ATP-binding subunit [bacterium]